MSVILLSRAFLAWERRIEVGALILLALLVWINRLSPSLKLHRHANRTCQLSLAESTYLIHRFVKGVKGMSFTNIRLFVNLPQKANILHVIFSFPVTATPTPNLICAIMTADDSLWVGMVNVVILDSCKFPANR